MKLVTFPNGQRYLSQVKMQPTNATWVEILILVTKLPLSSADKALLDLSNQGM
jgi:hypothetical protein